jgi:lysyl-tRNA synthetase class II
MPITPLEGIMYANQNMHVPASKQTDHQNRVEFQNVIAAARINEKPSVIEDVDDLLEKKAIDPEQEHQREEAEEQTGEKEIEVLKRYKKVSPGSNVEELFESLPYHILDIRV